MRIRVLTLPTETVGNVSCTPFALVDRVNADVAAELLTKMGEQLGAKATIIANELEADSIELSKFLAQHGYTLVNAAGGGGAGGSAFPASGGSGGGAAGFPGDQASGR